MDRTIRSPECGANLEDRFVKTAPKSHVVGLPITGHTVAGRAGMMTAAASIVIMLGADPASAQIPEPAVTQQDLIAPASLQALPQIVAPAPGPASAAGTAKPGAATTPTTGCVLPCTN